MSDTTTHPDPGCCPLCGGDNRCAMERERVTGEPQPPCWCVAQSFSAELLERLPESAKGQACICGNCLAAFHAGRMPNGSAA